MDKNRMKIVAPTLLALALMPIIFSVQTVSARTYIGSQTIGGIWTPRGNYYYISAERYCDTRSYTEVWARKNPYACSFGDKFLLRIYTLDVVKVKNALCQVKYVYDIGTLVGGCLAVGVCTACGFTGCGGGLGCAACIAACNWALLTGVKIAP